MAPEVLRMCGSYQLEPTDVWACGIVLVIMLTCEMPWESSVSCEYWEWNANPRRSPFYRIDTRALQLIGWILAEDADSRATIEDILLHFHLLG
jgi:serine/threonine-protein kinase CHEK1